MNKEEIIYNMKKIEDPALSVIIPFHGLKDELLMCLNGLNDQKAEFPFEIIIVESGNDFNLQDSVKVFSNVSLISSKKLLFPGKARNIGAEQASANLLAFIDSDCVPEKNWVSQAHHKLQSGLKIVIGPILNINSLLPISTIDNHLQFVDFQKYRPSKNISHFPGCNFAITKLLFNKLRGFPEDVKAGEDVLFSQAAIEKCSSKIYFDKKLVVQHKGRNKWKEFLKHNKTFGYYRGYLSLKISGRSFISKGNYFHSVFFGFKRLIYICVRTLQWNPVGMITLIVYFPLLIVGLSAWTNGFYNGNIQALKEVR